MIAYGESNVEVQGGSAVTVIGNFLLNPRGQNPRGQNFQCWSNCSNITVQNNYALSSLDTTKYLYPEAAVGLLGRTRNRVSGAAYVRDEANTESAGRDGGICIKESPVWQGSESGARPSASAPVPPECGKYCLGLDGGAEVIWAGPSQVARCL